MSDQPGANQPANRPPPTAAAQQIIWFALLGAVGMYALVGTVVTPNRAAPPMPPETLNMMTLVLCAVAIMTSGIALMAPRILSTWQPAQLFIVRCALAESVGIFGLMLRFLGASNTIFYSMIAWSFMLLITLRPNQDERR